MLNELKFHINIFRRYRFWSGSGCIYIHVPKAAGTSVNNALYGKTLGHYSARQIQSRFPSLFSECFTFSLVRNPWDRALSAYRFARVGRTESMGVRKPEQYQVPEFSSFERFVCDWLPSRDLSKCDFIFQPQHLFVCDENMKVMVDHLGYVERLAETICFVETRLGRTIDVKMANSTASRDANYRDAYVSNEMIEMVRSVYKDDIDLFGYEF